MKDVLYLESDEEITSAIDKMLALRGGTVSIVVPKRSTLLQSVVNLKLLKKAADGAGKELVLVTGDRTSTHLASRVGLAVANTLTAAPVLAKPPVLEPEVSEDIIEGVDEPEQPAPEEVAAVVASPGAKASAKSFKASLPFLNGKPATKADAAPETPKAPSSPAFTPAPATGKSAGTSKIPNFDNLQKRALIGGAILACIVGIFAAMFFFSKANVTLYAKGTKVRADFNFKVNTDSKESNAATGIVAGQELSLSKDLTSTVASTGKKDVGTQAKGTMTVYNEYDSSAQPLVAGTRFAAADGKIFRSTEDISVPGSTVKGGKIVAGTASVGVEADVAGDSYNLAPARYTIPGLSADKQATIYGQGSQMSGGTSKQISIVTQADIDNAKAALLGGDNEAARKDVESKAVDGYRPLAESFVVVSGAVTAQPAAGEEGDKTTVIIKVTYQELAVKNDDFTEMVKAQELKTVGEEGQVYDEGIENAVIVPAKATAENRDFSFSTEAYTGRKIDTSTLAKELAGKRYGEAIELAGQQDGVERAEVKMRPSWLPRLPRIVKNISVTIKVAGVE